MLLDGGDNTSSLRNYGSPVPNPDAIQEFRVVTNNYSAEYGPVGRSDCQRRDQVGHQRASTGARSSISATTLKRGQLLSRGARQAESAHVSGDTSAGPDHQGQDVLLRLLPGVSAFAGDCSATARSFRPSSSAAGTSPNRSFKNKPVVVYDPLTRQPFPGNVDSRSPGSARSRPSSSTDRPAAEQPERGSERVHDHDSAF